MVTIELGKKANGTTNLSPFLNCLSKQSAKENEMKNLNEACTLIQKSIEGTNLEVNFSGDDGAASIHWCGVIRLDCSPAVAAKAIVLFKQLEKFGAEDC